MPNCTRPIHPDREAGAVIHAVGSILGAIWLRISKWSRRNRHAAQLRNPSDAMLRDIGLTRSMIDRAVFVPIHPHRHTPHI